jgi:hypothetical protein
MVKQSLRFVGAAFLVATVGVATANAQGGYVRLQPDNNSGTIDANAEAVTLSRAAGYGSMSVQITGTFSGNIEPQCTTNGTTYQAIQMVPSNSSTPVSALSTTGLWWAPINCYGVRVVSTSWTSGSAIATVIITQQTFASLVDGSVLSGMSANMATAAQELTTIRQTLNVDVQAQNTAGSAGPQIMGECDDVSTVAVTTEGFAHRFRLNCTTREMAIGGGVAHDAVDAGQPIKIGGRAIVLGANPTSVADADRTDALYTRAGQQFVIGGHPNVFSYEWEIDDADGAQTNAALLTVSSGTKIIITSAYFTCDNDNSDDINMRLGLAAATLATADPATAAAGIILRHYGVPAGGGIQRGSGAGIIAIGADGEDLRLTMADPAGGACVVGVSGFTIAG